MCLTKNIIVLAILNLVLTVQCWNGGVGSEIPLDGLFDEELYRSSLDTERCQRHLSEMNAFEFYDTSFRIPKGVLGGSLVDYGHFERCLDIRQTIQDDIVEGKHCMISLDPSEGIVDLFPDVNWSDLNISWPIGGSNRGLDVNDVMVRSFEDTPVLGANLPIPMVRLGVCIPKTCTVQEALDRYINNSLIRVNYIEQYCRLPNDKPFVAADYLAIVLFSLLGLVTLLSTGYDVYSVHIGKQDPKTVNKLHTCFSVYTNTRRLFNLGSGSGALGCLDGIRSLSILWVIVGHTMLTMFYNVSNLIDVYEWMLSVQALWVSAATISVDAFFLLSGLLLVYTGVPKMTQASLVKKLHLFYLNRLLRMFPLLAAGVLLQASVFHRVDDGANWHFEAGWVQNCRYYWWASLLHVQNYYNPQLECLPQTWYLSVDIQLHIVSPLILFWALGSRRMGWVGLSTATAVSFIVSTVLCFTIVADPANNHQFVYYKNTLTRSPVFLIGMMYGFLLHVYRKERIQLAAWIATVYWVCALVVMACVVYTFRPYADESVVNQLLDDLINTFARPLWALGLGWIVVACVHGYSGPINWFLSLALWKFIARISYAMYIFHFPIQHIIVAATAVPIYFSMRNLAFKFLLELSLTVIMSISATIIVDAPFSTIIKVLLGGAPPRKPDPKLKIEYPPEHTEQVAEHELRTKV